MPEKVNFTQKILNATDPRPDGKRAYIYDKKVSGLGLSITSNNVKSFIVYRKIKGKPTRVTLGRYPDMTIEQARDQAIDTLSVIAGGVNPIEQKRIDKASDLDLATVLDSYLATRSLKPRTAQDYQSIVETCFKDWFKKPIAKLTRDKVKKRHRDLGETSQAHANYAMRVLRALFNYARGEYKHPDGRDLFPINPVSVLSDTRAWYKIKRKQSYIPKESISDWFNAVLSLEDDHPSSRASTTKDFLLFILLTGTRRNEAAQLKWSAVNLKSATFTLTDTKNGETITLPFSDYIFKIIQQRHKKHQSEYVFDGTGAHGYIVEPKRHVKKIRDQIGFSFSVHDLRRTFITIAESMDISPYTIKRLVNHKTGEKTDVTAGYIVVDIDRLRGASQKITDHILRLAKIRQGKVVKLNRA